MEEKDTGYCLWGLSRHGPRGVGYIVMGVVGMEGGLLGIVIMACRDRWEAGFFTLDYPA